MSTIRTNTLSNVAGTQSTAIENAINGSAKAWVNFNGTGTVAIRASYNVSSITDLGTGLYRINYTTAMSDANYAITISSANVFTNTNSANNIYNQLVGSFNWEHVENNSPTDMSELRAAIFR